MLNSALRSTLSEASIIDIVRNKRDALMADIRDKVKAGAERFGIDVVDVRIKRADLPAENSEAVFRRMQAERQRLAAKFRAQGSQQSQQIKADADAKVTVTSPRRSSRPSRSAAKATPSATASSPRPMASRPRVFRLLPLDAGL